MSQFFIDSVVHHKLCLWGCLWLSNSELISLFPPKQKQKQEKENIKKKENPTKFLGNMVQAQKGGGGRLGGWEKDEVNEHCIITCSFSSTSSCI